MAGLRRSNLRRRCKSTLEGRSKTPLPNRKETGVKEIKAIIRPFKLLMDGLERIKIRINAHTGNKRDGQDIHI